MRPRGIPKQRLGAVFVEVKMISGGNAFGTYVAVGYMSNAWLVVGIPPRIFCDSSFGEAFERTTVYPEIVVGRRSGSCDSSCGGWFRFGWQS